MNKSSSGFFSLVGIIVSIVIIAVVGTMALNYYRQSGAEKTINDVTNSAIETLLQADLVAAAAQLRIYEAQNGVYPITNDCSTPTVADSICLKISDGNTYEYTADNSGETKTFNLVATNSNGMSYKITNSSTPTKITDAN